MALKRKTDAVTETTTTPAVETTNTKPAPDDHLESIPAGPGSQHSAPARDTGSAVAAVKATQQAPPPSLSNPVVMDSLVLAECKDKFVAEYGMLPRITVSNGQFLDNDKKPLGTKIVFQVLSFNTNWTVAPNDTSAPIELVKYSRDGITIDGEPDLTVAEHLADLKMNWPQAKANEYLEVVVNLIEAEKPTELINEMVQLQLSPTSKKEFEGFRMQTSFKMANGILPLDAVNRVEAKAELASNAKKQTWTKAKFSCNTQ